MLGGILLKGLGDESKTVAVWQKKSPGMMKPLQGIFLYF
jgi:hypothetical protein